MTTRGLFKLALAAPLVVCLPFCAYGGEGDDESPKIFEEFSLTSSTTEAPSAAPSAMATATSSCCPAPSCCPGPSCNAPACGQGCGNDNGCCDGCFQDHCCPIFYSGVEATFLHASTHGMHADASATTFTRDHGTFDLANDEVFDRWTASPRVFAGVQQDCWGFEGRFWYLSDSSSTLNPFFPVPASGIGTYTDERIKAYTVDFEVTRSFCLWNSKVDFFLGGRYASFEAGQAIDISRQTGPTEVTFANVFTEFTFNGIGVTSGFQGRTPIGCDTCISLIYGARGSFLWGNSDRAVQTSDSVVNTGAAAASVNGAQAENCDTAFIVEGIVGLQWDHELRCLPMSAYLRIGAEIQYWDLGDNGAVASSTFALSAPGRGVSSGSVDNVDALLVGFFVGTGFNW